MKRLNLTFFFLIVICTQFSFPFSELIEIKKLKGKVVESINESKGIEDVKIRFIGGDEECRTDKKGEFSLDIFPEINKNYKLKISVFHKDYVPRVIEVDSEVTEDIIVKLVSKFVHNLIMQKPGAIYSDEEIKISVEIKEKGNKENKINNAEIYLLETTHRSISDPQGKFYITIQEGEFNYLNDPIKLLIKATRYRDQVMSVDKADARNAGIKIKIEREKGSGREEELEKKEQIDNQLAKIYDLLSNIANNLEQLVENQNNDLNKIKNKVLKDLPNSISELSASIKYIREQTDKFDYSPSVLSNDIKYVKERLKELDNSISALSKEIITDIGENQKDLTSILAKINRDIAELKDQNEIIENDLKEIKERKKEESKESFNNFVTLNLFSPYISTSTNLSNYQTSNIIITPLMVNIGYKGFNSNLAFFTLKKEDIKYSFLKLGFGRQIYSLEFCRNGHLIFYGGISMISWGIQNKLFDNIDLGIYGNLVMNLSLYKSKIFLGIQFNYDASLNKNKELGNSFQIFTFGLGIGFLL